MKKIMFSILMIIMFIPFIVNAETCDTSKVSISSIKVDSKSNEVEEINEATATGRDINLNLTMSEVGDKIKYKIVVKNDSNDDYELDKNNFNISSDYVKYSLESEDESIIVKANSTKTVYLRVEYKNAVKEESFKNGIYTDNKNMTINLSSNDKASVADIITNPDTGIKYYILIIIVLFTIIGTTVYLVMKKKNVKIMLLVIGTAIIIPLSVNALCKCEIKIDSKVNFYHPFTGTIYRASSTILKDGDTIDVKKISCTEERCNYIDENEYKINYSNSFIKHDIVDDIIIASYACRENICYKGGPNANFEENKNIFINNEEEIEYLSEGKLFNRLNNNRIDNLGNVRVGTYCGHCEVNADATSECLGLDTGEC